MDGYDVKKVMDQVHISSEMQEKVIINIQKQMVNGNKNTRSWNWRKMATVAAAFVLVAGVVSFPVRAFVTSVVKERMESIPREEVQEINDMVQSKPAEADIFSRVILRVKRNGRKSSGRHIRTGNSPKMSLHRWTMRRMRRRGRFAMSGLQAFSICRLRK